jgi:hypothetical protein
MLRVTIELVSAAHPSRSRVLGVAEIANVGGTVERGDYSVRLSKWAPKLSEAWRAGEVKGFDRVRRGPWDLLLYALVTLLGERNPQAGWDWEVLGGPGVTLERMALKPAPTEPRGLSSRDPGAFVEAVSARLDGLSPEAAAREAIGIALYNVAQTKCSWTLANPEGKYPEDVPLSLPPDGWGGDPDGR